MWKCLLKKKMANILYYEGISSHSQDNYDPPWLFGVEATQSADRFKIYSKKNHCLTEPRQYQLQQPNNYQDQSEVPHNSFIPWYSRRRPVGYNHNYNRYSHRQLMVTANTPDKHCHRSTTYTACSPESTNPPTKNRHIV